MNMITWLKANASKPLSLALINALFTAAVGIGAVLYTHHFAEADKSQQTKLEAIAKFDLAGSALIESGGKFISAINSGKGLEEAKSIIADKSTQQILAADQIKRVFQDDGVEIKKFLDAVSDFNKVARQTTQAIEIGPWLQSYDKIITQKSDVTAQLYKSAGV